MRILSLFNSVVFSFGLLLVGFSLMNYLKVPVGNFGDWIFAMISLFWLLAVVTVPWNIYFRAKAVLADAQPSRDRNLPVDENQVAFVRKLEKRSLLVAIGLHVASAIVLLILAAAGVSKFGYVAAVLALLLTALRPAASAYEYLVERLRNIRQAWHYPIEDVVELRARVDAIELKANETAKQIDPEIPDSLLATQRARIEQARENLASLEAQLTSLRATNENQHVELAQKAQSAIAQLSTDGQFLDHVREIIRFFKTA